MAYRIEHSYDWNYEHAPLWNEVQSDRLSRCRERLAALPASQTYAGIPVRSPVAVAAGPLLNGRWCLAYAALGFEIVTYKTVRSVARACYPLPNLQPVDVGNQAGVPPSVRCSTVMQGSWAVSFGMPSQPPDVWQRDVAWTREQLPDTHHLAVSVVGTTEQGSDLAHLAADYARCARWATSAGADVIEINFSCPNVCSTDGQLFQVPAQARQVAEAVAQALSKVGFTGPLLVKIGHQADPEALAALVESLADCVTGCIMTNSLPARVQDEAGRAMFGGQARGICGTATRTPAVKQVQRFAQLQTTTPHRLIAIGVGGVDSASHVQQYMEQGAEAVQVATAAMIYDDIAQRLKLRGAES